MDRYINDYEFSFDGEYHERSRRNTVRFCRDWRDLIYYMTQLDVYQLNWSDIPGVAHVCYLYSKKRMENEI